MSGRGAALLLLALLAAATARAQDAAELLPFRPRAGERWLVEVAEVTTRTLTFDDGERAERESRSSYALEVERVTRGELKLRFRALSVSGPGLSIEARPQGRLRSREGGWTWEGEPGAEDAQAWVRRAFAAGLPEALGPELLPKRAPRAGDRWPLALGKWRARLGLGARELVSFRGEGRCALGRGGELRLSISLKYRPEKLGALTLEPGAEFHLRVEAEEGVGEGWRADAQTRFDGVCPKAPAGPGRTRRAKVRHRQRRRYSRRRLP